MDNPNHNMAKQSKKRYIVSYVEEQISSDAAVEVLDISTSDLQDAVEVLSTDVPEDEADFLHFESLGATALPLSAREVSKLEEDDRVLQVVEDTEVFALNGGQGQSEPESLLPQPVPWNIELVKANLVWNRVTGRGVKVAIVDTGIDDNHPDLTVSGGVSFVPGVGSWDDDNGHGTHVAGIVGARNNPVGVIGVAPESDLYAVKVLGRKGTGHHSQVLAGLCWATQNGMDVVNLSLGRDVKKPDEPCTAIYQRLARILNNAGCIVVAAAGNSGEEINKWVGHPARCPGYMAVAAIDRNKNLAPFSSRGPADLCDDCGVEISAPGVSINSTYQGGGYRKLSGTSMACPHVSGAAALLKELHPTWTPDRIRERLKATASDLGAPGNDPGTGAGLIDCQCAVFGQRASGGKVRR